MIKYIRDRQYCDPDEFTAELREENVDDLHDLANARHNLDDAYKEWKDKVAETQFDPRFDQSKAS